MAIGSITRDQANAGNITTVTIRDAMRRLVDDMSGGLQRSSSRPWIWVICSLAAIFVLFVRPLSYLTRLALSDENVSHVLLVPFLVAWALRVDCRRIFRDSAFDSTAAVPFVICAIGSTASAYHMNDSSDALSYQILGFVFACIAVFALSFGRRVLREGAFAFLLLFLLVPWPSYILTKVVSYLQVGSAGIAAAIFYVSGVPVLREGLVFHLTRATIEVAPECSGIRSSMALLILALLVSHFAFRPLWKKLLFVAVGLLVMIIKNGTRIATLTLLANYVDPGFLFGRLQRQGGVVFFLLGLALLVPVYWLLRRGEKPPRVSISVGALQHAGDS